VRLQDVLPAAVDAVPRLRGLVQQQLGGLLGGLLQPVLDALPDAPQALRAEQQALPDAPQALRAEQQALPNALQGWSMVPDLQRAVLRYVP
jgi:hypothetical protein